MSRLVTLVVAATSALALSTVTTPAAVPAAPTTDSPSVVAGTTGARVGGSWCC